MARRPSRRRLRSPKISSAWIRSPTNDSLVIGKDNALVNAVVYLRVGAGGQKVEINPEYEAKLKEPVVLDNKGCMFHPHITTGARRARRSNVKSSDPVGHNTNISMLLV